jgi:hypothetical protein
MSEVQCPNGYDIIKRFVIFIIMWYMIFQKFKNILPLNKGIGVEF